VQCSATGAVRCRRDYSRQDSVCRANSVLVVRQHVEDKHGSRVADHAVERMIEASRVQEIDRFTISSDRHSPPLFTLLPRIIGSSIKQQLLNHGDEDGDEVHEGYEGHEDGEEVHEGAQDGHEGGKRVSRTVTWGSRVCGNVMNAMVGNRRSGSSCSLSIHACRLVVRQP
jgi:hypothetical protein